MPTSAGYSYGHLAQPNTWDLAQTFTAAPVVNAGIKFPAAAVAVADVNTLDDYEEGTFTLTDGSGAGLVITNVSASYVKLGKIVQFNCQFVYPATASGAVAILTGLPFAAAANSGASLGYQGGGPAALQVFAGGVLINFGIGVTGALATNTQMSTANCVVSGTYSI